MFSKSQNNFTLLRLLLSWSVILGHSYPLSNDLNHTDVIFRLLRFDYSGSLAVKMFFMLSGLLVIHSACSKQQASYFIISRLLRVYPGLFICLIVSTCVLGPMFTRFSINNYINQYELYLYIVTNLTFSSILWRLPGVFDGSSYGLNGSLWTISFELLCYGFVASVLFLSSGIRRESIVIISLKISCMAIIMATALVPEQIPYFGKNLEAQVLLALFCIGGLLSLFHDSISINFSLLLSLWFLQYILRTLDSLHLLFYTALFITLIFIFTNSYIRKLYISDDISYGVYLYGFPVQQSLYYLDPDIGAYRMFAFSVIISSVLGYVSWRIVEKPALSFRDPFVKALDGLMARTGRLSRRELPT